MKTKARHVALTTLCAALAVPTLAFAQAGQGAPARPAAPPPAAKPAPGAAARLDALAARVDALEALRTEHAEMDQSLDAVAAEVAAIKQELAELRRSAGSQDAVVQRLDALDARVSRLGETTTTLRADLDARTGPESAATRGGVRMTDKGIVVLDEEQFQLRIFAFAQLRYQERRSEADTGEAVESNFQVRRARIGFAGHAYTPKLTYQLLLELAGGNVRGMDAYLELDLGRGFNVRVGQFKVPFSRVVLASDQQLSFVERPIMNEELTYFDRDVGVSFGWKGLDGKLHALLGVMNGAGRGNANDNTDPMLAGRVEYTILGKPWRDEGDVSNTKTFGLLVGVGGTFENAPVPAIAGTKADPIEVVTDVDGDGKRDNVQVAQVGFELAARYRGFSLDGELVLRKEDWGSIGDGQMPPFSPRESLMGWYVQAEYFVVPEVFQVGARYSDTDVSPVAVQRARASAPVGDERTELSALASYHRFGHGFELTFQYSFLDWKLDGEALDDAGEHRFVLETQFSF